MYGSDEYRQKAEQCRDHARKSESDHDRAAWQKMADDWQELADSLDATYYEESAQLAGSSMDKRAAPRTPAFLKARAICRPDNAPVECLITDISATGARLQFADGGADTLPDRFELLMVKSGERPVVCVAWRSKHEMGVAFETPAEHPS